MRVSGRPLSILSQEEVTAIHHGALRILAEMGMEIQNQALLELLAEAGWPVDFVAQRVRFPADKVERFIGDCEPYDWSRQSPTLSVTAGVYQSLYHDPQTDRLEEWTEDTLAFYFALGRSLAHVDSAEMLGCRLPCPPPLEPLYERFYCWKHGAEEGSSIYQDELCPYLLEMYQMRASQQAQPIQTVFKGTVYLVPPLKLGVHEAFQVNYFRERGLRVGIGSMHSLGGSAPVTLAGAVTLNLAEQLALRMLDWVFFGVRRLHLGGSLAVMDLRTTSYRSAPVERPLANLMTAQMAQFYRASFSAHGNLTDAKRPGEEAGMQKVLTALPIFMTGGNIWMPAGLLSADQICSPLQLVLDNELIGALKRFLQEYDVGPDSIGVETILDVGPGGYYFDQLHTARNMRKEIWQPTLWQRTMLQPWLESGQKTDIDLAQEQIQALRRSIASEPPQFLTREEEKAFAGLLKRAEQVLE